MEHSERRKYELTIGLVSLVAILSMASNMLDDRGGTDGHVDMLSTLPAWPMALFTALAIMGEVALLVLAHRLPERGWRIAAYAWGLLALICTSVVAVMWLLQ